jgi:hypothetical protein
MTAEASPSTRTRPRAVANPAFDVLDALGGLARLVRRTPTLDGAVPVRVAQGCAPLLEGNAFGYQIELTRPLTLRARWGRALASWEARDAEELARACRAAVPRLVAEGLLEPGGAWHRALAKGPAWTRGAHVRLWTGLLVRPRPGVWLRASSCANRRNRLVDVEEAYVAGDAWVPLVLDVSLSRARARGPVTLRGEVACLAALAPNATLARGELADAPELAHAHAAFYDARYFQTKKSRVDAKYRRLLKRKPEVGLGFSATARVVSAGPAPFDVGEASRFLTAGAATPSRVAPDGGRLPHVVFRNAVGFRASFDGHTLTVEEDHGALAAAARAVEACFSRAVGEAFVAEHRGALLYMTKYFTPHPPGDPHFFLKPWAFTQTEGGWSTLLDGIHGDGYDVLRGVVATDAFHATPAVFALHDTGRAVEIPAGTPLLCAIPFPRDLAARPFAEVPW